MLVAFLCLCHYLSDIGAHLVKVHNWRTEWFTGLGYGSDSDENSGGESDDSRPGPRRGDQSSTSSDDDSDYEARVRRKREEFDRAQRNRLEEMDREEAEISNRKKSELLVGLVIVSNGNLICEWKTCLY